MRFLIIAGATKISLRKKGPGRTDWPDAVTGKVDPLPTTMDEERGGGTKRCYQNLEAPESMTQSVTAGGLKLTVLKLLARDC